MAKEVQMSIKMEAELRDQFMGIAASKHQPVAQIIRDLMRLYIENNEIPNELTAETLRKSDSGEDVI
jgi:predicted DNA-binding protein